jgi:hypothetical protein
MKKDIIKQMYEEQIFLKLSAVAYMASFIILVIASGMLGTVLDIDLGIKIFVILFVAGMLLCGVNMFFEPPIWEHQRYKMTKKEILYLKKLLEEQK